MPRGPARVPLTITESGGYTLAMRSVLTTVLLLASSLSAMANNFDELAVESWDVPARTVSSVPSIPSPSLFPVKIQPTADRNRHRYKDLLFDPRYSPSYEKALGTECVAELKKFYQKHDSFSSDYIIRHSKTISSLLGNTGPRVPVYHYTDTKTLINEFSPKIEDRNALHEQLSNPASPFTYSDLLFYPRSSGARGEKVTMWGWSNMETTVLYVADNPYTSSAYGHVQVAFWMNPNAKAFNIAAEEEVDSILKPCPMRAALRQERDKKRVIDTCDSGIFLIALEDSGVDLVDYTTKLHHPETQTGWYYLISVSNIVGNDALELGKQHASHPEIDQALSAAGRAAEISTGSTAVWK